MATEIERGTLRMTAGFYARGVNAILSDPKTSPEEREQTIKEIREMAQACADAGLVDLVKTPDLQPGNC